MKISIIFGRKILFATLAVLILSTCLTHSVSAQTSIYPQLQWPFYDPGSSECTDFSVSPGKGAPDGAQFPKLDPKKMASSINTWIAKENPRSTMKGLGATIVASAKKSNVNPFLIVTIAKKESSMADPSDFNVSHGNNSFGRTATTSQPHFQGNRLWYRWSSVKASVDYAAPENKNARGGGDMATYLRTQYGSQIDHDNLTALFLIYAPPGENDTAKYIAQVQGWINELIKLTKGGAVRGSGSPTDDSCSGAVSGDIVKTAIGYSWPEYRGHPYCIEKPSYKRAAEAAKNKGEYTGGTCTIGGTWVGVDCGAFVTRVMRDSGVDPSYNKYEGNTLFQKRYMDESPSKYRRLSNVAGTSQLQPGDIAISSEHTYIYVGSQPGFKGNSASASFSSTGDSWRSPMASNAYGFTDFTWYRFIK
jgi:hypothetical protein